MKITSTYRAFIAVLLVTIFGTAFTYHDRGGAQLKKPKKLTPLAYVLWIEGNQSGLTARATQGNLDFVLQFRPLEYVVVKEAISHKDVLTKKIVKERKHEIEGLEYYTFFMALNDGKRDVVKSLTKNEAEYDRLLRYFAGDLQQDLKLAVGTDTLNCKIFHFERTYGITTYARFMIGFEPTQAFKTKDRTLIFKAHELGLNAVELKIREEDIHNIPKINF